ncbi:DUF4136 domain-containing protein [Mucilaginibacter rubeus]|uniref:DUF4136 domain-containing protein n=1 Tax=Mucilaginibacter rubeus TaxID=2027860 RepID=A0AAE6MKX3_9SPHI|nr:DUF4136 domain-containing protein [Mucilaginibacter rubeus]QEM07116.1 DUF4136 domain-containing protein [Mucilaginibacter rubeus]QTE43741.1 DUF4136 domain-containing protein [Mucilaginibacter rubeus]QTE50340.1 DUF4136 domain-containing protein [Mucilaginibacter rubeus]QTE55427.1 DUF4136 domain-containing protein [Mucilaginibacter rubeus]QTE65111.1 DUF4136 domain-containing protein [Mucilaginibacter rubeus]
MKKSMWVSTGIMIIMLAGCSSIYNVVSSDYDRSADFTKYKTFAWLPDKADTANTSYNNEIIRNNIRNYFGQCISDRGYSFDAENPDVLMQLIITNAKKERVINAYPSSYYYSPYYYGSYYYSPYRLGYYYNYYSTFRYTYPGPAYPVAYSATQKQEYVNGAITLAFIDRKTGKLIWRGTAEGDIYDPSFISQDLHPAVHRILAEYPVKPLLTRSHKVR